MKTVIVFDVDGILADFSLGFTTLANKMYGTPIVSTRERKSWDDVPGISSAVEFSTWQEIRKSGTFWTGLEPLVTPDVFEQISCLNNEQYVYFATSRPGDTAKQQTTHWLFDHGIVCPSVVVTGYKGNFCRVVNADFAIDDKAGNAVAIQYGSTARSYILDREYNRYDHSVLGTKVIRVHSIREFLNDVGEHEKI